MKGFKKYFCLCLVAIMMFLNIGMAVAEPAAIEISRLETEIMPEYDTPDILIINAITFVNKSNLDFSGELKWRVPKGSFKHIVTENVNANAHLQFNLVPGKDYDEMVWKLSKPLKPEETKDIHLEFYYNNFQGNPDKQFSFDMSSSYPVFSPQVFLLQPLKATNFKVTPELGQPLTNKEWTYYSKSLNNLPPEQSFNLTVSYTKADPSPSVSLNQPQGQAQNNQTAQAAFPKTHKVLIFAVAAILIILIGALTYVHIQKNNLTQKYSENDFEDDFEEDTEEDTEEDAEEDEQEISAVSNSLEDQKRQLRKKFEEGSMIEYDYYEAILELEEKAKKNS